MPNHMHLTWEMLQMNGKEQPSASFMKFTSHQFQKNLIGLSAPLDTYKVDWYSRKYNFWRENSLAIELFSERVFLQKLSYMHTNPLQEKWRMVKVQEDYLYSSANFYS